MMNALAALFIIFYTDQRFHVGTRECGSYQLPRITAEAESRDHFLKHGVRFLSKFSSNISEIAHEPNVSVSGARLRASAAPNGWASLHEPATLKRFYVRGRQLEPLSVLTAIGEALVPVRFYSWWIVCLDYMNSVGFIR